jgi:hypothetical protein
MIIGHYIHSGDTALTPWMERQGDNLVITYEVIATGGQLPDGASPTDQVTFNLYSKNKEETGTPGSAVTSSDVAINGVGTDTLEFNSSTTASAGLKELVRIQVHMPVELDNSDEIARWARWRIKAIAWSDSGA